MNPPSTPAVRSLLAFLFTIAVAFLVAAEGRAEVRQTPESVSSLFDRAARAYHDGRFKDADDLCTQALNLLPPVAKATEAQRADWILGLEMRARIRFRNDNHEGARSDFVSLLEINPDFEGGVANARLSEFASDLIDALKRVKNDTIGTLRISVKPADATIKIDDVPVATDAGTLVKQLVAGRSYLVTASRPGFAEQKVAERIIPGIEIGKEVDLVRQSPVLFVKTVPSGVEILVNNVSQGVTKPLADRDGESAAFAIEKIGIGESDLTFRKSCFVEEPRKIQIDGLQDYELTAPVRLVAAVGRVVVGGTGKVSIDGVEKGEAPFTSEWLCERPYTIKVHAPDGLFMTTVQVAAGQDHPVEPIIRPAVAILSAVNLPPGFPRDLRTEVQNLLQQSAGLTFVVPSEGDANAAVRQRNLRPGWTEDGFYRELRETGSRELARQFVVQAVAEVTAISPQDSSNLRLTLLAAGSKQPDVISLNRADQNSMDASLKALGPAPALTDVSTGIQLVDARDVAGPVVVRSPGETGLLPGDVVLAADKQPVGDTAAFESYVAKQQPGATLTLHIRRGGVSVPPVQVKTVRTLRVVGFYDKSLLANKLLLQFRLLAGQATDVEEQASARLNLAVALMVLGRWDEAERQLHQVLLPDGPGVSKGTVKYLLGLCLDAQRRFPDANEAYGEAMAVKEALLTTGGPLIKDLAAAKLADKNRRDP